MLKYLSLVVSIDCFFSVGSPVFIKAIVFCVSLVGSQIANAAVWSLTVVKCDAFLNNTMSLVDILECISKIKFFLQNAIDSFGYRIFIRIAFLSHGDVNVRGQKKLHIRCAAILDAPVRVMDQRML